MKRVALGLALLGLAAPFAWAEETTGSNFPPGQEIVTTG